MPVSFHFIEILKAHHASEVFDIDIEIKNFGCNGLVLAAQTGVDPLVEMVVVETIQGGFDGKYRRGFDHLSCCRFYDWMVGGISERFDELFCGFGMDNAIAAVFIDYFIVNQIGDLQRNIAAAKGAVKEQTDAVFEVVDFIAQRQRPDSFAGRLVDILDQFGKEENLFLQEFFFCTQQIAGFGVDGGDGIEWCALEMLDGLEERFCLDHLIHEADGNVLAQPRVQFGIYESIFIEGAGHLYKCTVDS